MSSSTSSLDTILAMPRREAVPSGGYLRRRFAVGLATVLGVVAVCLIVFSATQKQSQIGTILGLWAGLIAAFVVFGARRNAADQAVGIPDLDELADRVAELQRSHLAATLEAQASSELALRRIGEVQQAREAVARREADLTLEMTLRREIERTLADQFETLRQEVGALRAEVVDKLGGQIKLERIETTRIIGSDLEALQSEIRRLAVRQANQADATALAVKPADVMPEPAEPMPSPPVPSPPVPSPRVPSPSVLSPSVPSPSVPSPAPMPSPPAPSPEPLPLREPVGSTSGWKTSQDPFADLPRLSPVSAEVAGLLKPVTPRPAAESSAARPAADRVAAAGPVLPVADEKGRRRAPELDPNSDLYVGRRRAAAERAARRAAREAVGRRRAPGHGTADRPEPDANPV